MLPTMLESLEIVSSFQILTTLVLVKVKQINDPPAVLG